MKRWRISLPPSWTHSKRSKGFLKKYEERIKSGLFAFSEGKPVGMVSCVYNDRVKTKHVADTCGVYVAVEKEKEIRKVSG